MRRLTAVADAIADGLMFVGMLSILAVVLK